MVLSNYCSQILFFIHRLPYLHNTKIDRASLQRIHITVIFPTNYSHTLNSVGRNYVYEHLWWEGKTKTSGETGLGATTTAVMVWYMARITTRRVSFKTVIRPRVSHPSPAPPTNAICDILPRGRPSCRSSIYRFAIHTAISVQISRYVDDIIIRLFIRPNILPLNLL